MKATTLNTEVKPNGIHYTLDDGTLIAIASYHAVSMYDLTFTDEVKNCGMCDPTSLFRLCLGLEAAEFYALAVASEYRRWTGKR